MKRAVLFIALLMLAAFVLEAQETTILKVKVSTANIRIDPDMNSATIRQVRIGTLLESPRKTGDWYEVRITDAEGLTQAGFIASNVVQVMEIRRILPVQPSAPPAAVPAQPSIPPAAVPTQPSAPPVAAPAQPSPPVSPPTAEPAGPAALIFGRFGSFSPADEIFKTVYGSGSVFGGELRFRGAGSVYVSLGGGYFNRPGAMTETQEATTMTLYPFEAMVLYHVLPGTVMPYLGAGAAACQYKEEDAIGKTEGWGLGFTVCGGVSVSWKNLGLDARVKYTSITVKPLEVEALLGGLTLSFAAGVVF